MPRARSARLERLVLVALLLLPAAAGATHFDAGTWSWRRDTTYVSAVDKRYFVTYLGAWRWSFNYPPQYPAVGTVLTGAVGWQATGSGWSTSADLPLTVLGAEAIKDSMYVRATLTLTIPNYAFPVTLYTQGCCRDSYLDEGNHDASFRLATVIDPALGDASPRVPLFSAIFLPEDLPASIAIPVDVSTGYFPAFDFSPLADSLLVTRRPNGDPSCAASGCACNGEPPFGGVCAANMQTTPGGFLTWTPATSGEYTFQLRVGSKDSGAISKAAIPLDVQVTVVPQVPVYSVSVTLPATNPITYEVGVGSVSFGVSATRTGSISGNVGLVSTPLPGNATFTTTPGSTTTTGAFSWTPTRADLGRNAVCFQGSMTTTVPIPSVVYSPGLQCVSIDVTDPDPDLDGLANSQDNCDQEANLDQADGDADGVGDVCDNCAGTANANQSDFDFDEVGDVCDSDDDNDGVGDPGDCAPLYSLLWAAPQNPVLDVRLAKNPGPRLTWTTPTFAGCTAPVFDVLRAGNPAGFADPLAVCVVKSDTSKDVTDAGSWPDSFYYVRIRNGCGSLLAPNSSGGAPAAKVCP